MLAAMKAAHFRCEVEITTTAPLHSLVRPADEAAYPSADEKCDVRADAVQFGGVVLVLDHGRAHACRGTAINASLDAHSGKFPDSKIITRGP